MLCQTTAYVDLKNIEHNTALVRSKLSPQTKIMAAVKAEAYGHGLAAVSNKLYSLGVKSFAVACLDVGHVGLPTGTAYEAQDFVRALGHLRLKSLHIHVNDYKWDLHQMPYRGKLDWDSITAALGEINYDGDFTYEVDFDYVERAKASGGLEMLEAELVYMEKVGRILVEKIEKSRSK